MSTVGFIGLGAMGSRLAGRLLDAGHTVYGTNRTPAKAAPLIDRGMTWRDTPREVAAAAQFTISMVRDDDALVAVNDGPDGIAAGLRPGTTYIDMSTVSPAASRGLAERIARIGAVMLDAPVSGSIPQAETGTLTIMVGGDPGAFAAAEPLLEILGQSVTRVGSNGQGLLLKLAINISLAVQTLAFAEGLRLAELGGVDPETATAVMGTSPIASPMLRGRIPLLLDLPQSAWFDVDLMHKDIRLARDAAAELGTPLPSARAADDVLERASRLGYGHRDIAAVREVLARTPATRQRAA